MDVHAVLSSILSLGSVHGMAGLDMIQFIVAPSRQFQAEIEANGGTLDDPSGDLKEGEENKKL